MITIAWDIDDVLNSLMKNWLIYFYASENSAKSIAYSELTENPPYKLLGIEKNHYLLLLDQFRLDYFLKLTPTPEIFRWFEQFGHHAQHLAVTSTPLKTAHLSAYWVMKHFGRWIRTFHIIPSGRTDVNIPPYYTTKADFLCSLRSVDIFIDDNMQNVREVKENGIQTYLFQQPWNRGGIPVQNILDTLTQTVEASR